MAARTPWIVAGAVALLAAVAASVGYVRRTPEPPHHPPVPASASATQAPEAPPPPPSAEELALIAPLAVGSDLAGFKVERVIGVRGGVLRLVCVKDKATVRLDVALADEEGVVAPPATAGKYAVFYSLGAALPEEGDRLAQGLAAVLKAHPDMAPPRGMTKFTPKEKPGVAL